MSEKCAFSQPMATLSRMAVSRAVLDALLTPQPAYGS